jgi:hypothetical protein
MDRLLNVMTLFSLGLVVVVLASLRRAHIRVEYSVSWLGAAVILVILSRSSTLLHWMTSQLEINEPGLTLIMIVFSVFLVVFYRFSVIISHLKDANIAMAQRMAILEYQIESIHEQQSQ